MVEQQISNLYTRVRFPSPAPITDNYKLKTKNFVIASEVASDATKRGNLNYCHAEFISASLLSLRFVYYRKKLGNLYSSQLNEQFNWISFH